MRIGSFIFDNIGDYAAALAADHFVAALVTGGADRGIAEAVVAASCVGEFPVCEEADGETETFGGKVAAAVLKGRTLMILATKKGLRVRLDSITVAEALVGQLVDVETMARRHAEWFGMAGKDEADYQLPGGGKIVLTGSEKHWEQWDA